MAESVRKHNFQIMENWLAFGQSDVWESFGRAGFAVGLAWDRFWDKFDVTLDPNGITLVLFYCRFGPVWDIALRLLMEMCISFAIFAFFCDHRAIKHRFGSTWGMQAQY